ncbi:MBL fold metallo-hydrolase [Flammeovirga sp. SJP92]|uniref:MBL fold metallo-hydrolase n=1 Tax=Flammeovirga sp. SJP92 TaxID=1775430 RepID=UPI000786E32D|nr:MBL fold metallo-hydrolase [Flammeovirga sp. SJP92]KXX68635.1 hypothetical protein AVL50_23030 [Flammeovirga sp. SJP92]
MTKTLLNSVLLFFYCINNVYSTDLPEIDVLLKKMNYQDGTISYHVKSRETIHQFGHYSKPEEYKILLFDTETRYSEGKIFSKVIYEYNGNNFYQYSYTHQQKKIVKKFGSVDVKASSLEDQLVYFSNIYLFLKAIDRNQCCINKKGKDIFSFISNGIEYFFHINKENLVDEIFYYYYDNVYGDSKKSISFSDYRKVKNQLLPFQLEYRENELLLRVSEVEHYSYSDRLENEVLTQLEIKIQNDFVFNQITEDFWQIELPAFNVKTYLYKNYDKLLLFEAPVELSINRKLIRAIKTKFELPIEACFISHHHPDHAGGVLAYVEDDIPIVTTSKNVEYFKKLAKNKHSIGLEKPFIPNGSYDQYLIVKEGKIQQLFGIKCQEIGAKTSHTEEFLIFYLEEEKSVIVADLILFPEEKNLTIGKRGIGLYEAILASKVVVEKIYTNWPLTGQQKFGDYSAFEKAVKQKIEN